MISTCFEGLTPRTEACEAVRCESIFWGAACKTSGAPNANLPEPMKSFVGSAFGWVVDTRVDKATNVWTFKWIPNQHADVVKISGSVKVEPLTANSVRCTGDITAEANVFGIGGAIEGFLQMGFNEGWKNGATFINKWIADGKPIA